MNREILRVERVTQSIGNVKILSDAWIHILEGETTGIAGLDNSGKTQFMKVIAGLSEYDSGNLFCRGIRVKKEDSKILRTSISYIGNESKIMDELSIIDNLFILKENKIKDFIVHYHHKKADCERILKEIHIEASWNSPCRILEDNEKQRLEIKKEIQQGSRLIILDCTGHVYGDHDIQELKLLMNQAKAEGISFIFINSNMEYMMELSDTIFVLKNGRTIRNLRKDKFEKQLLYTLMAGYYVDDNLKVRSQETAAGAEVLRLEQVSFGLVDEISLSVKKKEIVGILSLSSRWNSDFISVLMGNEKPQKGKIFRNGTQVGMKYLKNRSTPQNKTCFICKSDMRGELFSNLSIQQNYVFLAQLKAAGFPFGYLSRRVEGHLSQSDEQELGFPVEMLKKPVSSLTNKEQFRLLIGRLKLFRPELLIMLNPMENSDIILKKEIVRELGEMARENTGVLLISANYKEMSALCDKILFIRSGKIRGMVSRDDFELVNMNHYL